MLKNKIDKATRNAAGRIPLALGLLLLLLVGLLGTGCRETPKYGSLEGLWEITSLTDGDGEEVEYVHRRYFAFQRNVVQLRYEDGVFHTCSGNFHYSDSVITMDFPYLSEMRDPSLVRYWGILSNPVSLRIVERTDSRLVMVNEEGWTFICRKF